MDLPETITIWVECKNDGLGGKTWDGPFQAPGRFALKQEKTTSTSGDDFMSKAVCYSESPELAKRKVRVFFGVSDKPEPVDEADDVRKFVAIPSGTNMIKAWF